MGEPISTAASVVGIVVPAMHYARLLLEDIKNIRGAPDTVAVLQKEIGEVVLASEDLKAVEPSELESLGVATQSVSAIKKCDEACDDFRKQLRHWTKQSPEGVKLTKWGRVKVGFFEAKNINAMHTRLQTCRSTLVSVVTTANLRSSIRLTGMTTDIRNQTTRTQLQITAAMRVHEGQLAENEKNLADMSLNDAGSGGSDEVAATDGKSEALKQIAGLQKDLSESREILEVLLAKAKDTSGTDIANVNVSDHGRMLSGVINTEGKYVNARVNISNLTATSGGRGVAGIVDNLDLNNFFNNNQDKVNST